VKEWTLSAVVFALLADHAGQPLDLEKLDPDATLNAMIASFGGDQIELVPLHRDYDSLTG
jgi:cell filamentation protein